MQFFPRYEAFPPPSSTLFGPVVCFHCFNFVNNWAKLQTCPLFWCQVTNRSCPVSLFLAYNRWQWWFLPSLPVPLGFDRANCAVRQCDQRVADGSIRCVCLLVDRNRDPSHLGTRALKSARLLHLRSISNHYMFSYFNLCFNVGGGGGGGWIIVGTAKSFVKQYGGRFIEILDSAYSMLQMGCCHVIIWIKPFHQKSGLEEISGGLVCRRHASLLCGDQMA